MRRKRWYDLLGGDTAGGGPVGDPPTIQFDADPKTGSPGVWTLEPAPSGGISSEQSLTGSWTDPDSSVSEPIASIEAFVDGVPIAGTVDDGDETSTGAPWSFSSSNFTLLDEGKTFSVKITDFNGNTAEASVTLDVNFDDPLQKATGHPITDTRSAWTWTTGNPTFADDNPNGGSTWATAPTGFDGGVILNGTAKTLSYTHSGATKYFTPKFQIMVPDGDTVARVVRTINGDTLGDDNYPYNEVYTSAAYADETNVLMFTFQLDDGDTVTIDFTGERTQGTPTDANLPFLTMADMFETAVAPPPPAGTVRFSWTPKEPGATKTAWDAYRASLPATHPSGRPKGQTLTRLTMSSGHRLFAPTPHEVAEMDTDGLTHHRYAGAGDDHTLITAYGASSPATDGFYWRPNRDYVIEFETEYLTDVIANADYLSPTNMPYLIIWEWWQPMNWPGWVGGGEVPCQLILHNDGGTNVIKARVAGSTQSSPATYTTQTLTKIMDWSPGPHAWKIEMRADYTGGESGAGTAYFRVYNHGVLLLDIDNQEIGINGIGDAVLGSATSNFGLYTSGGSVSGAKVRSSRFKITDVT